MPIYSLSVCLNVSNYFGVPHTLHPASRFRRTSFQLMSLPSNMSKRPVNGFPAPLMSFRASAACMEPMLPTKGGKQPKVATAGVGHITIVDNDTVDVTNLQRQIAHTTADVGTYKALSAQQKIAALNPDVQVSTVLQRADAASLDRLVA